MLEYKQKRNNGRTPFAGVYKFVCVCVWKRGVETFPGSHTAGRWVYHSCNLPCTITIAVHALISNVNLHLSAFEIQCAYVHVFLST